MQRQLPRHTALSRATHQALRSWALLEHPPAPHLAANAPVASWDYTFTTDYPGTTAVRLRAGGVHAVR
jgi:hypothetical protein